MQTYQYLRSLVLFVVSFYVCMGYNLFSLVWKFYMAGSLKWFVYTDDLGTNYGIFLDESNTEAVNGATGDMTGTDIPNAVPRNIKVREVFYTNPQRTRTIRCVCLTSDIYSGIISGGTPTIPDPIDPSGPALGLIRGNGERRRLPVPLDSGLDDGDET